MRTRNKKLSDYGLSPEDMRTIKGYCTRCPDAHGAVKFIAKAVNAAIAEAVTASICEGKSYNSLDVYLPESDFYGYRRKCCSVIKRLMQECDIWSKCEETNIGHNEK